MKISPFHSLEFAARALFLAALGGAFPSTHRACSVCGCSLSDDWGGGSYDMMPGFQSEIRYEYADFTSLRADTESVDRPSVETPHDREIQQETLSRTVWLGLDYVGSPKWGVDVQLPYSNRFHTTVAPGDRDLSTSRGGGIGDLRVLGRWQNFSFARSLAFQLGLKLPTGRFDQDFADGPAAGTPLDRGLQRGTGTTDALAGISYFARPATNWGCFAQVQLQQPLAEREGFLPSSGLFLNAGIRYLNTSRLTPQLQLNLRWDRREHGPNGDRDNSGDSIADLSPGLSAELTLHLSAYVFVLLPVYERVNGWQLEPKWQLASGVRWKF